MLLISTRLQYGLLALLCLAQENTPKPLSLKIVSQKSKTSLKYLERIFSLLRKAGIVESTRGPEGGYTLTKKIEDISLLEIFIALEKKIISVECLKKGNLCKKNANCPEYYLWLDFAQVISDFLKTKSLKDLLIYNNNPKQVKIENYFNKMGNQGGYKNVK